MPFREAVRRAEHFVVHKVLRLDDTPHRIALGVALAMWIAWTPTVGLQSVLLVALCTLVGANKVVGLPFVWISNPATFVPIFYPNYRVGCWLLRRASTEGDALEAARQLESMLDWYEAVAPIFLELWIGSIAVATPIGLLSYVVVRQMIVTYRRTYQDWKNRKSLRD